MTYENKKIKDICLFVGGSQPPKSEFIHYPKEGYVRLIQIRDRLNDKFITFVPETSVTKFCEPDDILIGRYGPPIFQIFRGFKGAYNVAIMKAIPQNGVNKDYLYYFLLQDCILAYVDKMSARTAGQTGVELDSLYEYPVLLPTIEGQNKIAKLLKNIDNKIEINNKITSELEGISKEIYDYRFVQFDFPDKNGKPYKSNGGKMVWNEELKREIPDGWEVKTLGDVCDIYQPEILSAKDCVENGKYFVHGSNSIIGKYNEFNHKNSEIIVSCRGDCGNIHRTLPEMWITGNAMVVRLKDESIHNEYLYQSLFYAGIKNISTGSVQGQITRSNISPLKIVIPQGGITDKFSELVKPIVDRKIGNKLENYKLEELRNFLLPMLMNGQVTVK